MKISCLLPTESRPEFMPLVVSSFDGQTWPDRELVVSASMKDSETIDYLTHHISPGRLIVCPPTPPLHPLGKKYQLALNHASGDAVQMWGDDDWSHPSRLEIPGRFLRDHAEEFDVAVPKAPIWECCLRTGKWRLGGSLYMGSITMKMGLAREIGFDPVAHCVDTRWMKTMQIKIEHKGRVGHVETEVPIVLVLYHAKNHPLPRVLGAEDPLPPLGIGDMDRKGVEAMIEEIRAVHYGKGR